MVLLLRWRWGLADGEFRVSIDFVDGVGPQSPVDGRIWSEWRGCLWIGGIVGLLVEGAVEEAVGDCRYLGT